MSLVQKIHVEESISREALIEKLASLHYTRVAHVVKPGEFAVRGNLFDIFPVTYRSPVRLEFEYETIRSIHDFSLQSGESFASFQEVFLIPLSKHFEKKAARLEKRFEKLEPVLGFRDLRRGDYVVHLRFGIGRFLGLKSLQIKGHRKKCLAIEYANQEILYVDPAEPVERYIGGEGRPPKLTKLHSKEWQRLQDKTRKAVSTIAHDLLEIQASRSLAQGHSIGPDHVWQKTFEKEFPFKETPDQTQATHEIKVDMERTRPMDRLLAGDVGYGKTEVAIRAAFKTVMAGMQVAFLVPTTVLAEQHYVVLSERMKKYPIRVEVLSRFKSPREQKLVVSGLKSGDVDIVVGTHRLLSRDLGFKNLGLLVIDEEQRFGVRHKERMKQLKAQVDVLTMTATPIPRTLYMSLVGVRDMSVIQTPPSTRLPIETAILEYDDEKIKEAIENELRRGGQVYFIHNRVQSIEKIFHHLHELLPQVRFGVGHGQMSPHELEVVMREFFQGKIDCLISTSIIESGIDIPNVNTVIVNRADQFGLSDLYQIRGRVGRYQEIRQAYAYFMVPKNWVLSRQAEKRLSAIERFTDLGSGFKIALEDLEIRGAGNLLGHEQSGFIHAVGFDMYCRLLQEAVTSQKKASKSSFKNTSAAFASRNKN